MPKIIWSGNSGCLLPFLIIFNLFFGKAIFNSPRLWLGIEAILILIFILKINIMAQKIKQQFTSGGRNRKPKGEIIDIPGQVIEEKKKLG